MTQQRSMPSITNYNNIISITNYNNNLAAHRVADDAAAVDTELVEELHHVLRHAHVPHAPRLIVLYHCILYCVVLYHVITYIISYYIITSCAMLTFYYMQYKHPVLPRARVPHAP